MCHFSEQSLLTVQIIPTVTHWRALRWQRHKMGLMLEQRNNDQGKKKPPKNKYKEYHCKQALIYSVAELSRGGWSTVKQQNERADSVERAAAREKEANAQYIFRGTFFLTQPINVGCFMVCS